MKNKQSCDYLYGQFSGECTQFRMDVMILLNTLELFGD
jgi:hypothetical protein